MAILVAACLLLRVPALDRVSLNPDESQYEATASYLITTDRSGFAVPYGTPATMELYRIVALAFGSYAMFEVRLLVLLVCLATTLLLYAIVRTQTTVWAGLLTGLVFLHYNLEFEGLSANREWFAGLFVVLGMFLYVVSNGRGDRARSWILLGAGFACGTGAWFKLQALAMALPIPAALVWEAVGSRNWLRSMRAVSVYAAGGVLAALVYALRFALAGTLAEYLGFLATFWKGYVVEASAAGSTGEALHLWFDRFFRELPFRSIPLAAYVFAGLCLFAVVSRIVRGTDAGPPVLRSNAAVLFTAYLALAMFAVKAGSRFFLHYYLLMLPALAVLFGFAMHAALQVVRESRRVRAVALGVLGLLLADWTIRFVTAAWPHSRGVLAHGLLVLAVAAFALARPLRRVGIALAALLCLEAAVLAVQTQRAPPPPSLVFVPSGYPRLVRQIETLRDPADRLFVWGWSPEIYSLTRMPAASHYTICQYIVGDYGVNRAAGLDTGRASELMRNLRQTPPRFVVDASRRSWTMDALDDPWIYRLDLYPDFELVDMLAEDYELKGRFDDCDLYVRRE